MIVKMNQTKPLSQRIYSLAGSKLNAFLILAIAPLPALFYFGPLSAVIPLYGFLLLLIKSQKLLAFKEALTSQKIIGAAILIGSFLAYFAVVHIYAEAAFYTNANYAAYVVGLFLIFFEFRALKESITPLILITATTSSALMSQALKPILSPYANRLGLIIVGILRLLGINASVYYRSETAIIAFRSLSGTTVAGAFVYECMGIYSILVFSIILVVILFEDPDRPRVKLAYSIIGLIGTFAVNILRVTIIFVTNYFYGMEAGGTVHYIIGYALFSAWLIAFLLAYSKRQAVHAGFTSIRRKIAGQPAR